MNDALQGRMYVVRNRAAEPPELPPGLEDDLRAKVERLSFPRHFEGERRANERACEMLAEAFDGWGFQVVVDGPWRNVVALPRERTGPLTLVGAHYDSVPRCPGADDNASAVAALLWAAERLGPEHPVLYVAFNREEDGLIGSDEFVSHGLDRLQLERSQLATAHVLEMLGFTSDTQRVPPGIPVRAPEHGRFLGLLAKDATNPVLRQVSARAERAGLPVVGLQTWFGVDRWMPDLHRSDHSPFWRAGIPALLWTDTAEFRNPHYHQPTDTPETLDYAFLARVTLALVEAIGP